MPRRNFRVFSAASTIKGRFLGSLRTLILRCTNECKYLRLFYEAAHGSSLLRDDRLFHQKEKLSSRPQGLSRLLEFKKCSTYPLENPPSFGDCLRTR